MSCGGVGEGVGVSEEDKSAFGEAEAVGDVSVIGVPLCGVDSCAIRIEIDEIQANEAQKNRDPVVDIGSRH